MADLADRLRACLPQRVAIGQAFVGEPEAGFEGEVLRAATVQRVAEFRTGRQAARRAMAELGIAAVAIPMAADRAPIWPVGVVGSISHCDGICLALVASAQSVGGLGLDIEPLRDLPAEVWQTILRPEELNAVQGVRAAHQGKFALRYFVAKEAVYKAQYPISRCLFDFQTIRIVFENQMFTAEFMRDIPAFPKGTHIEGTLVETFDFIAAVVILP